MTGIPAGMLSGTGSAQHDLTVELSGSTTMEFAWIEPGRFLMGAPVEKGSPDLDSGHARKLGRDQGRISLNPSRKGR